MVKRREKTKYPKLYKNTYWGKAKYEDGDDFTTNGKYLESGSIKTTNIIENRNKFAEQFKLKKLLDTKTVNLLINTELIDNYELIKKYYGKLDYVYFMLEIRRLVLDENKLFNDHVEVYETYDNKIIMLSNPYNDKNERYYEFLEKTGFIDLDYRLYSGSSVSFYKIFNKEDVSLSILTKKVKAKYREYEKSIRSN